MALVAKQNICILCGDFRLKDTTGTYNVDTNPGGYGAPNPDFGVRTPYTAEFFPPKADLTLPPLYTLNLYDNPPAPVDGIYTYFVPKTDLGYTSDQDPVSGVWSIRITLGTDVKVIQYLATGAIQKRIISCICSGGKEYIALDYDLRAANRAFCCFKPERAQMMIDELYRQTNACCGCGCG